MTALRPAFTGPELCAREAHEIVTMLKRGDISPNDCIDAALARIEAVEPSINAMPTLCAERAYAAAEALKAAAAERTEQDSAGWLAAGIQKSGATLYCRYARSTGRPLKS